MTGAPWTFEQAHHKAQQASLAQEAAEAFVKDAYRQYAEAERIYRQALSERIVELRAEGVPVTIVNDVAKGDKRVAVLRRDRDVAEGVKEAAVQAAWRRSADRRAVEAFTDWSKRRDLAEGAGRLPEPPATETFGARRALA